jgi:hypothetical protein
VELQEAFHFFVSCRKTIVINANYARCVQVPSEKDKRRCTREQTENTAGIVPCLNAKENYAISAELNTYVASKNEKSLSPRPHSCSNILCEEFSSTTIDVAIILQICPKNGLFKLL